MSAGRHVGGDSTHKPVPDFPVVVDCPYCTAEVISGWVTDESGDRLALFNISNNQPHVCREMG